MKANDLLKYPETAYIKLPSEKYVAEQELAEKYRAVVSEILRLSLAGFGVFTLLGIDARTPECIRILVVLALFCFAASAGLAVWFLYGASEGLRWYIAGLRYSEMSDEAVRPPEAKEISLAWGRPGAKAMLEKRDKIVRWCF